MDEGIKLSRDLNYLRVAAAVPDLRLANVDFNINSMIELIRKASAQGVQALVFPEMCLTGYTIADLVQHQALLDKAVEGLRLLLAESRQHQMLITAGLPISADQRIYNCAAVINQGTLLGLIPKTHLPNYKEFYDSRWFESGGDSKAATLAIAGQAVPFGTDLLFRLNGYAGAIVGIEICEDLWVPLAPHEYQALGGATVILNLSASNEVLGKSEWRRTMIASESGRCLAAYVYASAGIGESSNDLVFGGHSLIAENGVILHESVRLQKNSQLIMAEVDFGRLAFDRRMNTSFQEASTSARPFRIIETQVKEVEAVKLYRKIDPQPFVPSDSSNRAERCREIFSMQLGALAKKLTGAKTKNIVLGVSGGLDSTLALLAAVKTMDFLEMPRTNVFSYTLPGFGTTRRTRTNATKLCQALGTSFQRVNIVRTCNSYLKDLGHVGEEDVVFENAQARYRTGFLFNKANEVGGINLGTGDLTEVALGWSTFGGDQISGYHINVSVPKTLVRYLVRWVADEELANSEAQKILYDILDTPISPELKRPKAGEIAQKSEDIIGPMELADFYLYPFIRFGMPPGKILFLANEVNNQGLFEGKYTLEELHRWLKSFIVRFFHNQFKRTCMPEGPKVGSVSLSPRGDWRMPSDAEASLWLEDLEAMFRKMRH